MENSPDTTPTRPFGYWLRAVDRLLAREFETAFEKDGASRRDWRLLSLLSDEAVTPELRERLHRHGGKKLSGLIERGWVTDSDGAWTLTDEGRAAHARLAVAAGAIRARVAEAVTPEDFATTVASLEAIATELGWNPDERLPRGHRRGFDHGRRGFGPRGFGRGGFGPGHRPGFGPGYRPDDHRADDIPTRGHADEPCDRGPGAHRGHGTHRGRGAHRAHSAERAYERGFDAGFQRGSATREA